MSQEIVPTEIKLLQKARVLQLRFDDEQLFELPCHFLRINSPSAEARLDRQGTENSVNTEVNIIGIEPVGQYGVKLIFDDGHSTGIYSWRLLHELALKWQAKENTIP